MNILNLHQILLIW